MHGLRRKSSVKISLGSVARRDLIRALKDKLRPTWYRHAFELSAFVFLSISLSMSPAKLEVDLDLSSPTTARLCWYVCCASRLSCCNFLRGSQGLSQQRFCDPLLLYKKYCFCWSIEWIARRCFLFVLTGLDLFLLIGSEWINEKIIWLHKDPWCAF
jgi:hypothetical protein